MCAKCRRLSISPAVEASCAALSYPARSVVRMTVWSFTLLFIFLWSPESVLGQTTVAVARDSQGIVLAADSRGTPHQNPSQFVRICKIRRVGDFWFTAAGLLDTGLNGVRVDLYATIEKAGSVRGSLREKAEAFVTMFEPELNRLIAEMQRSEAGYYQAKVLAQPVVEVVFAGIEAGIPIYFTRDFIGPATLGEPAKVRIVRDDVIGDLKPNTLQFSCRGYCLGATTFIGKRSSIVQLGIIELTRFIVTYEIIERPDIVGAPVDILKIDKAGAHWIERKPECEEKHETKSRGKRVRRI